MGWYFDSLMGLEEKHDTSYYKTAEPSVLEGLEREDQDDDKYDEIANMPHRLKRQFRIWDVLKGHDLSSLRWDVIGSYEDLGSGQGERGSKPPPADDPRTQLPEIFGFGGWNMYGSPDFRIHEEHPSCYPQELVERLRVLHEHGVGGRREDGVVYVVTQEEGEVFECDPSDDCDGAESGSDDGSGSDDEGEETANSTKVAEAFRPSGEEPLMAQIGDYWYEWHFIDCVGTYETLELANDAAMSLFERKYRKNLEFQQSSNEDDGNTPDFNLGLHKILPEGQEKRLLRNSGEGSTWRLTRSGCLKLTGIEDEEFSMFAVVRKGQKPQDTEDLANKLEPLFAGGTEKPAPREKDVARSASNIEAEKRGRAVDGKRMAEEGREELPVPAGATKLAASIEHDTARPTSKAKAKKKAMKMALRGEEHSGHYPHQKLPAGPVETASRELEIVRSVSEVEAKSTDSMDRQDFGLHHYHRRLPTAAENAASNWARGRGVCASSIAVRPNKTKRIGDGGVGPRSKRRRRRESGFK